MSPVKNKDIKKPIVINWGLEPPRTLVEMEAALREPNLLQYLLGPVGGSSPVIQRRSPRDAQELWVYVQSTLGPEGAAYFYHPDMTDMGVEVFKRFTALMDPRAQFSFNGEERFYDLGLETEFAVASRLAHLIIGQFSEAQQETAYQRLLLIFQIRLYSRPNLSRETFDRIIFEDLRKRLIAQFSALI